MEILRPYLVKKNRSPKKKHRDGAKNGIISNATRLSVALRYFAGGRPEDISLVHGISHSEVFNSVWLIVDAVNKCPKLKIGFPEDHAEQRRIAAGFKSKSVPGFDCVVGAIDGMLVWTEKPSMFSTLLAKCGSRRFYCGRKHKYGLNMQGLCDSEGRFLDVTVAHPASFSDFLVFSDTKLYRRLEEPNFLAKGLIILGDLAYVNCRYFATPFKSVSSGPKDAYNFYHSQLRIKIECAFGMLVGRWGIMRKALPATMGLRKTTALVLALCKLHNFCINERLEFLDPNG